MNHHKTIRRAAAKATAFFLTICMLAGLGTFPAYADGADQDTPLVVDGSQNPAETGKITVSVVDDDACGITVTTASGVGAAQQISTGDVNVTVDGQDSYMPFYNGTGIALEEGANASNKIETGDITVSVTANNTSADAFGIVAETRAGGHQTAISTGSIMVTVDADDYSNAVGLDLYSSNTVAGDGSTLEIAVDGDITVHDELTTAQGVRLYNDMGTGNTVSITVNGDITATMSTDDPDELAEGMSLDTEGAGNSTSVVVDGDVTADRNGLGILTMSGGSSDVVVTGTISGKYVGVAFDGDVDAGNTSLTTWKIDSEGTLVDDMFGTMSGAEIATIAQTVIHYIVKLIQPAQGDVLKAVGNDGGELATKTFTTKDGEQTVLTGNEDGIVRLTLTDDRYEIVRAENADSGVSLEKDERGFFYRITRGGGILLSAILQEKQAPGPEPQPGPKPRPSGSAGIRIVYELDGGLYQGDPGPIIRSCSPGELIYLLDAPEKDGFTFDGWRLEVEHKIESYPANAAFRPRSSLTFTAIWKEA